MNRVFYSKDVLPRLGIHSARDWRILVAVCFLAVAATGVFLWIGNMYLASNELSAPSATTGYLFDVGSVKKAAESAREMDKKAADLINQGIKYVDPSLVR